MAKRKTKRSTRPAAASPPAQNNSSPMNIELLERLVKLMTANDLSTMEVRDGQRRVVLKRGAEPAAMTAMHAMPAGFAPTGGTTASPNSATASADIEKDLLAIKSPMVGTYYAAASPDAPPFVSVGSDVDEDSDVCIIEAMKVFNNIKAECRGTIAKVLVQNGQTVEFGQVLFLVKPR